MAGSLTEEFMTLVNRVESTAETALNGIMKDHLIESLAQSARDHVYNYPAKQFFMAKRRYMIADETNMLDRGSGLTLILENQTHLQKGDAGEVNIVEEGMKSYNQPYPRPFMEEGLTKYAAGAASEDLVGELLAAGFDAHV